ncbi:Protein of unknown function [Gryllus bimaculatus]|nr:Protein of unknown function [Gryllus bimaculatus]
MNKFHYNVHLKCSKIEKNDCLKTPLQYLFAAEANPLMVSFIKYSVLPLFLVYGEHVACELRALQDPVIKRWCKCAISEALLKAHKEDIVNLQGIEENT